MQKIVLLALASLGALVFWETSRRKNGSEPLGSANEAADEPVDAVSEAQIRAVMKHLGKRSGKVRGARA